MNTIEIVQKQEFDFRYKYNIIFEEIFFAKGGIVLIKGASMFACAGIGELLLKSAGVEIVIANELLARRADFYKCIHNTNEIIIGDIQKNEVKSEFLSKITEDVKFLIATPPCQGVSNLGKNKNFDDKLKDPRNYLIFDVLEVIDKNDFDYILIENVPAFLQLYLPYKNELYNVEEILRDKYSDLYTIEAKVLNAKDYGVPQSRPRAIIKIYKIGLSWEWPIKEKEITVEEAIGYLPSLESGEKSDIKWHYARKHTLEHIECMQHTPTGKSAFENEIYFPKNKKGERVKGFKSTYKRMNWDRPAPAITMRSDAISSQENVHPGRLKPDGTYSDARVLSILELLILFSIPLDTDIPDWATDTFIRQIIGEAIPPLMTQKIVGGINHD